MDALRERARKLRALAGETRLRILAATAGTELSVSELTGVLNMGQSRVSGHLAILREAGLVSARREGARTLYAATEDPAAHALMDGLGSGGVLAADARAVAAILRERRAAARAARDGALGGGVPGRTWEGLARALLHLLPRGRTADVGIGEGDLTLLLARVSTELVAVDISETVLRRAAAKAEREGVRNIAFRRGDAGRLPLADGEVDLCVLSQILHGLDEPGAAVAEAWRVLRPSGRVLVMDLRRHHEEEIRRRLGHRHAGFEDRTLRAMLRKAGFADVVVERAARDRAPPHFISVLAVGRKP